MSTLGKAEDEDTDEWGVQITTSSQPVDNAISKIEELANSLVQTVNFTEGLEENFQELAKSLVELESDRLQLHDELEIETINASIMRHSLRTRPPEYQKELQEAVLAARKMNEDTIKTLQDKLKVASDQMVTFKEQQEILQSENTKLMPDRDRVMKQHDEIISALNQKMADKASKQITLNEIKDALRDTLQHRSDYGVGMKNLQEDMDEFHKESQAEEKRLRQEVAETQDAIATQTQKNKDEKRLNDQLNDKIMDMNSKINVVQKDIRRTENAKTRLEVQCMQIVEKIDRERMMNQQTEEETIMLEAARDKQKMEYDYKLADLEEKSKKAELDMMHAQYEHEQLTRTKDDVFLKKQDAVWEKSKAQAGVREIAKMVQSMKHKTTNLIEKTAMLSKQNVEIQEDMVKLEENHNATVDTFNQQIEEYRTELEQETEERHKAQEEREETEKVLDDFRTEQVKFMNDMTKQIEEGRRQHKLLSSKSSQFNMDIAKNKVKTGVLTSDLEMAEKGFDLMVRELTMEIERLKTSIELYNSENIKKEQFIEDKKPVLKDLEVELEETGKEYNVFKNEVVAVRNREKSVKEQLKRSQILLEKLVKPHDKLKEDIKGCRSENLATLRKNANERKVLEAEIYDRTRKLENVLEENERFKLQCELKTETVNELTSDMQSHGNYQKFLARELIELENKFMEAWEKCVEMEHEAAETDKQILEGIRTLQDETMERGKLLTHISDHLQSELQNLTGFLDNVNSRRPKDTRQDRRRSTKLGTPSSRSMSKRPSQTKRAPSFPSTPSGKLPQMSTQPSSIPLTGSTSFQNRSYTSVKA